MGGGRTQLEELRLAGDGAYEQVRCWKLRVITMSASSL